MACVGEWLASLRQSESSTSISPFGSARSLWVRTKRLVASSRVSGCILLRVNRNESIGKWQRVFGDGFAAGEAKEAARVSESFSHNAAFAVPNQRNDLVERIKLLGSSELPSSIARLPYVKQPKWRVGTQSYHIKISADLLMSLHGASIGPVHSLDLLQKGRGIRFTACNSSSLPFGTNYKVEWRVTNTDKAAYDANVLRGDFYSSDRAFSRSEELSYRGVHFVEAFLISKLDDRMYGKSEPFYVVIE
jgi:Adenylyl/Guanylyl and SMODS C-terminal sensor domain